jgi:hypothetical protein
VRFTGRQAEAHRQAIGVHDRMNLACQSASRAPHLLLAVAPDAGSVLVHSHNRGVDHLHRRIMSRGKRIHDLIPDASLRQRTKRL